MNTFTTLEKIYIVKVVLREKLAMLECIDPLSGLDERDLSLAAHNQFLSDVENIFEENSK
jgi:hypothetical protein